MSLVSKTIQQLENVHDDHSEELDDLEQYTRLTNVRTFVIAENAEENTDDLVVNFFNSELGIDVSLNDLSRRHRVGRKLNLSEAKAYHR